MKIFTTALAASLLATSAVASAAPTAPVRASQAIPSATVEVERATAPAQEESKVGSSTFLLILAAAAAIGGIVAATTNNSNG
jgi:hypothetical protein